MQLLLLTDNARKLVGLSFDWNALHIHHTYTVTLTWNVRADTTHYIFQARDPDGYKSKRTTIPLKFYLFPKQRG